ncbi:gfo/Idh/MocA family oxidoreductase [Alteromonas aestuariivivens]|uniref:Gfo/Idh/MocA family oxidoreductase n=1 Tax=Alteromonas aestuariivivens TaxID=1938339 RepID=A0A3D8ME88_9ALTE|nr:Gfo/Idh/MocA family oxidoreductase [Alteromonas aestuariivivens]RDV29145.1 gfo/Idh/MocA family oxidoreductase [Alteromonas aestuariivivens]
MSDNLTVVCSGTGYFSQFHYEAWNRLPGATIVGVNNRNRDKAMEFAQRFNIGDYDNDLQRLLERCKPDLVDVITPPETHLQAVKIAAGLGIDVICQKPFGENLEQAQEMTRIAADAGIKLIVHENFRFMPWYRKIKQLLDENRLGEVLNVEFKLRPGDGQGPEAYLARQPYFQQMPKFLVHETAIHLVDTFRFLFGEPNNLFAKLRRCNPHIKGEDAGLILFEFQNRIQAVFDGNRLLDHCATNTRRTMGEMEIAGTHGELRLNGEGGILLREFGRQQWVEQPYEWRDQHFGGDCVFNTIEHIAAHYLTGAALENQGFEYLKNIEIEQAIYHSAHSGNLIAF